MTAIGFLLLVLGFLIMQVWGVPYPDSLWRKANNADKVGISMMAFGFTLLLGVVTVWLWEVMP